MLGSTRGDSIQYNLDTSGSDWYVDFDAAIETDFNNDSFSRIDLLAVLFDEIERLGGSDSQSNIDEDALIENLFDVGEHFDADATFIFDDSTGDLSSLDSEPSDLDADINYDVEEGDSDTSSSISG